jgi:hypothetical protein
MGAMPKPDARPHHKWCDGHIDCPDCGDSCCRIILWAEGPGPAIPGVTRRTRAYRPLRVACLGCGLVYQLPKPSRSGR